MEKQTALPPKRPPLSGAFYFTLLLPLVFMGIAGALVDLGDFFIPVLGIAAIAVLVCSAILAMQLARRFSQTDEAGVGVVIGMFIALQVFYGLFFFIGYRILLT